MSHSYRPTLKLTIPQENTINIFSWNYVTHNNTYGIATFKIKDSFERLKAEEKISDRKREAVETKRRKLNRRRFH